MIFNFVQNFHCFHQPNFKEYFPPFFIWFQFTKAKVQNFVIPSRFSLAKVAKNATSFEPWTLSFEDFLINFRLAFLCSWLAANKIFEYFFLLPKFFRLLIMVVSRSEKFLIRLLSNQKSSFNDWFLGFWKVLSLAADYGRQTTGIWNE